MKGILFLFLTVVIILASCGKKSFSHLEDNQVAKAIAERYGQPIDTSYMDSLRNRSFYLGIVLQDTFLGGELTYTQKADYDLNRSCIQFCYLLFDEHDNVLYNTVASDSILRNISVKIPHEVDLQASSSDVILHALYGKYVVSNDTLKMLLESQEQEELIEIYALITSDSRISVEFLTVTRKRLNFSPLINRKKVQSKQKVFDVRNVFSIPLRFKEIPNHGGQDIIFITKSSPN